MNFHLGRWKALLAALVVACPYILWDAWVAGSHWHFNPKYILGISLGGLPLEEILFFFTVPFACMYLWEMIFEKRSSEPNERLRWVRWLCWGGGAVGLVFLWWGKGYTGLMLLALGIAAWLDAWLRTDLLLQRRTYGFLAAVGVCTLIFNGYLTWRPVVLYEASQQLGFRIGTIPIEDFGYGWSLILCNLIIYERLWGRVSDPTYRSWLAQGIERAFGGYRHQVNAIDEQLPTKCQTGHRVCIIGGGLAGLSAAIRLSQRGFQVRLIEKNDYLGGKVGSWPVPLHTGEIASVSHGFHAFFPHYYNLNAMLGELGVDGHMKRIEDYLILTRDGRRCSFRNIATTPLLNLLSLASHGMYSLRKVAMGPAGQKMEVFLQYDRDATFAAFDQQSYADFVESAQLPTDLQLMFNTFSRAFFAQADKMSMAELIKSFHFYYLSNDGGLLYDYMDDDYQHTLLTPAQRYLTERGARIDLGQEIDAIHRDEDGFEILGERFDSVVLAADVKGARAIIERSTSLCESYPAWSAQISRQRPSQRYSVLRIWTDRDIDPALPPFFITDKTQVLDAIAVYHRIEKESAAWVNTHGGGIFELHSYAVPEQLGRADANTAQSTDAATNPQSAGESVEEAENRQIRDHLLEEFWSYFPAMRDMKILDEHLQVRRDFAAFHVGMYADRPGTHTDVPGLYLAGDWVKLPYPAMLMEAACMSGLICANAICAREGLQEAPVYSVPLKGFLATLGIQRPGRSKTQEGR